MDAPLAGVEEDEQFIGSYPDGQGVQGLFGPPREDPLRYGSLSVSLAARLLSRTFQQFGIILCPVSRCYFTPAFTSEDLTCLRERARAAFAAAGRKIARLVAAGR